MTGGTLMGCDRHLGRRARVVAALAVLTGCGSTGTSTPSPSSSVASTSASQASTTPVTASATPSATPTPGPRPAQVLLDVGSDSTGRRVDVLNLDGTVAGVLHVPGPAVASDMATAAGRLFFVDSAAASDGHLVSVGLGSGRVDLGALAAHARNVSHIVVSADGSRWAWGVLTDANDRQLWVAGTGLSPRKVLDGGSSVNRVTEALAWTDRGVLVVTSAVGLGGCCYLIDEAGLVDARVLDPGTLQVVRGPVALGCGAMAATGELGCVHAAGQQGSDPAPTIVHVDGSTAAVTPVTPGGQCGWVRFSADGRQLAFGVVVSNGSGGSDGPYDIRLDVAATAGGAARELARQQLPDAWLPDGRLIVESAPAVPAATSPTVGIMAADGAVTVLAGGYFVGILD